MHLSSILTDPTVPKDRIEQNISVISVLNPMNKIKIIFSNSLINSYKTIIRYLKQLNINN